MKTILVVLLLTTLLSNSALAAKIKVLDSDIVNLMVGECTTIEDKDLREVCYGNCSLIFNKNLRRMCIEDEEMSYGYSGEEVGESEESH